MSHHIGSLQETSEDNHCQSLLGMKHHHNNCVEFSTRNQTHNPDNQALGLMVVQIVHLLV
jgi:hypothetical protein